MRFPLVTRRRLEALESRLQLAQEEADRWRDQAAKARTEVAGQAKKLEELEEARADLDRRHGFLGVLVTWLARKFGGVVRPTVAELEEVAAGWGFRIVDDNAFRRGPGYRIETGRIRQAEPAAHEGNGKAPAAPPAPPAAAPEPAAAPPALEEAPEPPRLRVLPPEPGGGEGGP